MRKRILHFFIHTPQGELFVIAIACVFVSFLIYTTTLRFTDVKVSTQNGVIISKSMPFWQPVLPEKPRLHVIEGTIRKEAFAQRSVSIAPNDCIKAVVINGQQVLRESDLPLCDQNGSVFPLGLYLKEGNNHVAMIVTNADWRVGMQLKNTLYDPLYFTLSMVQLIIVCLFIYRLTRMLGFGRTIGFVMTAGLILRYVYLLYAPYEGGHYDLDGHVDYALYVIRNSALPPYHYCWECYQPPFYYLFLALIIKPIIFFGAGNIFTGFQYASLFLTFAMYFFGLLFMRLFTHNKHALVLSALAMVFLPSGVFHSVRVTNDVMFYAIAAGYLYAIAKWWMHRQQTKWLIASSIIAALGLLTKGTGVLLITMTILLVGYWVVKEKTLRNKIKVIILISLIFLIGTVFTFRRTIFKHNADDFLIGNYGSLNSALYVGNKPFNYIWFDANTFIRTPYLNPWIDEGGRQFFWNFFLKSSLFGDYHMDDPIHRGLAQGISILFLFVLGCLFVGVVRLGKKDLKRLAVPILFILLTLTLTIVGRIRYHTSVNADFRFVYPLVIPVGLLYGYAAESRGRNKLIQKYGQYIGLALFVVVVILYFIIPAKVTY